ncbi:MAG: hypothetical protein GAK29_01428 [Acinetobacter bereziniae]|uniref:Uncharacterized protein n=1 Tax=Acinetobacter bereziniae TaxID=106648 RepID=A0A833PGX7_ACIBZ|nr:MAG: hypothetical protein GAK29_01428 [Acinetobacter bereziniae]
MSAYDFVKLEGWKKAKDYLRNAEKERWSGVAFGDLRQLIYYYDVVMDHGSIDRAREYANSPYTAPEIKAVIIKAIAEMEKCQ